ncbi:MAG: hypothetical protein CMH82_16140 [Nocardioides sp.]|nr:hypothetical protein [Nocardioides sp.]
MSVDMPGGIARAGGRRPPASVIAAAMRVGGVLGNFVVLVVFARIMELASFGALSALIALAAFLSVPAVRGSDQSAIRLVAIADGKGDETRAAIQFLRRRTYVGSLVFGGGMMLVGAVLGLYGEAQEATAVIATGATVAPLALIRVTEGSLRGTGGVLSALVSTNVLLPSATIVMALVWALASGWHLDTIEAALARLIASVATAATALGILAFRMRQLPSHSFGLSTHKIARDHGRATFWLMVVGVSNAALTQLDVVALALIGSAADAGLYSAASRLAISMNIALVAVNFALAPAAARLFGRQDIEGLQRAVTRAARLATLFAGGLALAMALAAPLLLSIFGPEFSDAATPLRILAIGYLVSAFCGPVGTVLNMTSAQRSSGVVMLVAVAVDILLLILLIPPLGATGAAISTASSMVIWNVSMAVVARRRLGVDATAIGWRVKDAR